MVTVLALAYKKHIVWLIYFATDLHPFVRALCSYNDRLFIHKMHSFDVMMRSTRIQKHPHNTLRGRGYWFVW